MTHPMSGVQGLPTFTRHITTHNADGIAIFETSDPAKSTPSNSSGAGSLAAEPTWSNFPTSAFGLGYATDHMPPDFNGNGDLATFNKYQEQHPGVVIKGGSVFRAVDMAPGATSPMHRTVSIDYGVILEGEIELELDSGEKRLLKRGDMFVQRGTMHKWKNPSESQPARLVVVQLESKELEVEGKGALKEEFRF
ncbi:hypothetical protein A1O7_08415 [Cladophialophora yegresii CBS 114405]|uniref:Cupin type-2 domain-containing protein n=1 Tax=Cladophialophora yegresii CBS 114405 TaxID=1182544 RepID=W9VJ21_9EURO|nr:uncharacterized protein A1O7_08415 [Cladophialophora yegresii CBS 114405]EXJ55488.1 hypothetical protein A1O7_08415 [Cladophialophora yegresii CBS 114405]